MSVEQTSGFVEEAEDDTPARKGPLAFRTISEVADELKVPQHVLRFWETRFEQVHPLKRGGGRRYYRPEDVELLKRIAALLYVKGYTIKGVQRVLREKGTEGLEEEVNAAASQPPAVAEAASESDDEADAEEPAGSPSAFPEPETVPEIVTVTVRDERLDGEHAAMREGLERVLDRLRAIRAVLADACP